MLDGLGDELQRTAALVQRHRAAEADTHGLGRVAVGAECGAGDHADTLHSQVGRKLDRAPAG